MESPLLTLQETHLGAAILSNVVEPWGTGHFSKWLYTWLNFQLETLRLAHGKPAETAELPGISISFGGYSDKLLLFMQAFGPPGRTFFGREVAMVS